MGTKEIAVVVSNANKNGNVIDTIDAIKKAGFKNVFIQWYNRDWNPTQEEQLKYIKEQGLNVIFAHLDYHNIDDLWIETSDSNKLIQDYKNDIKICKNNSINMVIMHLTYRDDVNKYNEIGLKKLQEIVDYAESLNVKVAFENTKIKGYLEYVIENIKNKNVGFCFDSGHYHVFFNDELDFSKFKNRVFAVHLHDNDKSDDLHLIPFEGTLNWNNVIKNLKKCNYEGPITLELCYRYKYLEMSIEDFYKEGFEAGKKLEKMLRK